MVNIHIVGAGQCASIIRAIPPAGGGLARAICLYARAVPLEHRFAHVTSTGNGFPRWEEVPIVARHIDKRQHGEGSEMLLGLRRHGNARLRSVSDVSAKEMVTERYAHPWTYRCRERVRHHERQEADEDGKDRRSHDVRLVAVEYRSRSSSKL